MCGEERSEDDGNKASSSASSEFDSRTHTLHCCYERVPHQQPNLDTRTANSTKRPRPHSPDKLSSSSSSSSSAAKRQLLVHTPAQELEQLHISQDMGSQRATELYTQLRAAVAQPDVNHQLAKSLLAQLKVCVCVCVV